MSGIIRTILSPDARKNARQKAYIESDGVKYGFFGPVRNFASSVQANTRLLEEYSPSNLSHTYRNPLGKGRKKRTQKRRKSYRKK